MKTIFKMCLIFTAIFAALLVFESYRNPLPPELQTQGAVVGSALICLVPLAFFVVAGIVWTHGRFLVPHVKGVVGLFGDKR